MTDPVNGNLSVIGETAYYTCAVNYTLNGESQLTCGTDGSGWSSSPPSCGKSEWLSATDINPYTVLFESDFLFH